MEMGFESCARITEPAWACSAIAAPELSRHLSASLLSWKPDRPAALGWSQIDDRRHQRRGGFLRQDEDKDLIKANGVLRSWGLVGPLSSEGHIKMAREGEYLSR